MYRVVVEELLGLRLVDNHLIIEPLLPKEWQSFVLTYTHHNTSWRITLLRGDKQTTLDNQVVEDHRIAVVLDGRQHAVQAVRSGNRSVVQRPRPKAPPVPQDQQADHQHSDLPLHQK
jgi:cellobiose phosphorylase